MKTTISSSRDGRRLTVQAGSTEDDPADLGRIGPSHRSARHTYYGHPLWLGCEHAHGRRRPCLPESCQLGIALADGGNTYPWFQRACQLLRRRNQLEVLWQRHARLACLFTGLIKPSFPSGSYYCHVPCARWWSSNSLNPSKAAPPAMSSWENLAWLS